MRHRRVAEGRAVGGGGARAARRHNKPHSQKRRRKPHPPWCPRSTKSGVTVGMHNNKAYGASRGGGGGGGAARARGRRKIWGSGDPRSPFPPRPSHFPKRKNARDRAPPTHTPAVAPSLPWPSPTATPSWRRRRCVSRFVWGGSGRPRLTIAMPPITLPPPLLTQPSTRHAAPRGAALRSAPPRARRGPAPPPAAMPPAGTPLPPSYGDVPPAPPVERRAGKRKRERGGGGWT